MALDVPLPPDESRQSLDEGLRRLQGHARAAALSGAIGEAAPTVTHPHQVFALNLDDVANGAGLESARAVGWRYLLTRPAALGGLAVAAAEVNRQGDQHRFSQLHQGWLSEETRKAIDIASTAPQVVAGSYELRALRVPALLVDAIWLKDKAGNNDLVVPIRSNTNEIEDGKVYAAADFLARLREIAARKKQFPGFEGKPRRG